MIWTRAVPIGSFFVINCYQQSIANKITKKINDQLGEALEKFKK
jgi:hypothetical protein